MNELVIMTVLVNRMAQNPFMDSVESRHFMHIPNVFV